MTDTDPTERVERVDFDFTPAIVVEAPAPILADAPIARGKRFARGTMAPPVARVAAVELPTRLVRTPKRWGRVVRVDLDGAPIVAAPRVAVKRVSPLPFAGVLAAAIVPLAFLVLRTAPEASAAPPPPAAPPAVVEVAEPTITPILAPGEGLVAIDSTPPSHIVIDGRDTGLSTPQELRLPVGVHRVTLVDDAHRLEDHSDVDVGATPVSVTRDLSAFLR